MHCWWATQSRSPAGSSVTPGTSGGRLNIEPLPPLMGQACSMFFRFLSVERSTTVVIHRALCGLINGYDHVERKGEQFPVIRKWQYFNTCSVKSVAIQRRLWLRILVHHLTEALVEYIQQVLTRTTEQLSVVSAYTHVFI